MHLLCKAMQKKSAFLIIVALVIGVVIGYVVGWGTAPQPTIQTVTLPPTTYTVTVTERPGVTPAPTQTVTVTVTPAIGVVQPSEIVITAWTQGPERESIYRQLNLELAAEKLNTILRDLNIPLTVRIEGEFSTASWTDYRKKLYMALEAGTGPCIFLTAHIDTAVLSENNWVIPLDEYIQKYWNFTYYDVIPGLWDAVRYKGRVWGVPQDTEARPIYFNKILLKRLGWSDEEINDLPRKIRDGEFTLEDMLRVAKEAVDKGVVEPGYAIWHRPNPGPDWPIVYLAYGGKLYDDTTGKLVADMRVWRKYFEFFYKASMQNYRLISDMLTSLDWNRDIHPTIVAGKVLFWMGGTWHKGQWVSSFGLTEEQFWEMFGFALYPAGEKGLKPVTLSQPMAYFISKACPYPELAFLIVTLATDPYLNSLHAVPSAHLAILYSQLVNPLYIRDRFLKETGYMVEYAKYQPLHPKWGEYSTSIFEIVKGIETGGFRSVDEALAAFKNLLTTRLGDNVIIIE